MGQSAPLLDEAHRLAAAAPGEEYVYGACAPGWHTAAPHDEAVDQWLSAVREAGVERVVCLLPGRQLDETGANVARYRCVFGTEHVRHAPLPDDGLADAGWLRESVLPFLRESVEDRQRVVVHGLTGIGRTGYVLAAWLVDGRGYQPHEAVDTVREMGRDPEALLERADDGPKDLYEQLSRLG